MDRREAQIRRAVAAIRLKEVTSVREASRIYSIPRSTLQHRLAGTKSRSEAMESYQRLTIAEEDSIVRIALEMQVRGWPLTIRALETFAKHYLKARKDTTPLGRQWYNSFLTRHPELKLQRVRDLDKQQQKERLSYYPLKDWFELDEKGLMKGLRDDVDVVVSPTDEASSTN